MKTSVSKKQNWLAAALIIIALFLLTLPLYFPADIPYLLLMVGRFHPVVLHFPIVLIVLALVLELLRRSGMLRNADFVVTMILIAAALSALVAIASGFLLYGSGDYAGALMDQHLWIGILTGVCILLTASFFLFYRTTGKFYTLYMMGLIVSNGAVAFASHLGGSVTHGEDYLTEYLPMVFSKPVEEKKKSPSELLVFDDVLVPVFEAKCVSCHNENRSKGELSMTSYQQMLKGGESGIPGIVAGLPDSSELYKRIVLPEGHKDRMPPEGKMPMTANETSLFAYWIRGGAKQDKRVDELRNDKTINAELLEVLPALDRYKRKQELAKAKGVELERDLQRLAMEMNVEITRDSTADEGEMYMLNMKFPPASFSGGQLNRLMPYAQVFSRVSLVSSGITDEVLYHISKMENLKTLFLQKTNINGSGIVHLLNLKELEVLNLSFTKVDDKSALDLLKIPNLREVYLMHTNATPEMIKALQAYKPTLKILVEEGPYR